MERLLEITPQSERALVWARTLAEEIGPRRPASRAERLAGEWLRAELAEAGIEARLDPVPAYSTFALPQAVVLGLACAVELLPPTWRRSRGAGAALAAILGALEDQPRLRPVARLWTRLGRSQNLSAVVEPREPAARTLCIVSHIDSSRSGLLFHPALAPHLRRLIWATSASMLIQAGEAFLCGSRAGRRVARLARGLPALGLVLLAERELRGEDVPGANDNASGVALTAMLTVEAAAHPPRSTRIVLLVTGAEEAGLLGSCAFLENRDTEGWLFLNFDGVAAPATLRYLPREGVVASWAADPGLIRVAEALRARRPDLGLERMKKPAGLPYDATPVLARGGRALTISAQDGTIPNYHQPSDDASNLDPETFARALEIGHELIAAIDRGEAD